MDLKTTKRVKNLYECFKKKDYEKIVQQVDSNFTWYAFGGPEFNPIAGIYRGRMGFEDLFNIIENNVMYEDFEPEQFIPSADGKKVVVVGHTKSKSKLIPNSSWRNDKWVHIIQINPKSELIEEVQDFLTPDEMTPSAMYE
eukprot:TRINITY_DN8417_c0_g1_i1.p1 TRINITY_DN8417_c0_g1~~TRINITY_DN8417_c0_g1_i1.p1  ORF type:complete len:151 (-),score=27.23 TRINITY_DN8417_c0_g1_i1:70-492(-)